MDRVELCRLTAAVVHASPVPMTLRRVRLGVLAHDRAAAYRKADITRAIVALVGMKILRPVSDRGVASVEWRGMR
jgi:hypothetical protein